MDHLDRAILLCTEIGLQTYGRRGDQLKLTADWEKLQMAEAMAREIRSLIKQAQRHA